MYYNDDGTILAPMIENTGAGWQKPFLYSFWFQSSIAAQNFLDIIYAHGMPFLCGDSGPLRKPHLPIYRAQHMIGFWRENFGWILEPLKIPCLSELFIGFSEHRIASKSLIRVALALVLEKLAGAMWSSWVVTLDAGADFLILQVRYDKDGGQRPLVHLSQYLQGDGWKALLCSSSLRYFRFSHTWAKLAFSRQFSTMGSEALKGHFHLRFGISVCCYPEAWSHCLFISQWSSESLLSKFLSCFW
jgi:hypothetical protein